MKTNYIKWKPVWENYFDGYLGYQNSIENLDCSKNESKPSNDKNNTSQVDIAKILFEPLDSSSDKFYPVDENYFLYSVEPENNLNNDKIKCPETILKNTINDNENTIESNSFKKKCDEKIPSNQKVVCSKPVGKQPDNIIFQCNTGQGFAFVTGKNECLSYAPYNACISKTLGIISIDTTCLKNPNTRVLFSSNIYFKPRNGLATSQLEFVLSHSCNNGTENQIGNWVHDLVEKHEGISQTFKFSFCNYNSFPGHYSYFVRVLPIYIKNCSVLITNCHINAIAQST